MKVLVFSTDGFKPKKQTHHLKYINYHLNDFDINKYPERLRSEIKEIHEERSKFFIKHLDDLQSGVWCFINDSKINPLNYSKRNTPCFEADLPDNTECYDCNLERLTTITDTELLLGGCYIPERELDKLSNIHRKLMQW